MIPAENEYPEERDEARFDNIKCIRKYWKECQRYGRLELGTIPKV